MQHRAYPDLLQGNVIVHVQSVHSHCFDFTIELVEHGVGIIDSGILSDEVLLADCRKHVFLNSWHTCAWDVSVQTRHSNLAVTLKLMQAYCKWELNCNGIEAEVRLCRLQCRLLLLLF